MARTLVSLSLAVACLLLCIVSGLQLAGAAETAKQVLPTDAELAGSDDALGAAGAHAAAASAEQQPRDNLSEAGIVHEQPQHRPVDLSSKTAHAGPAEQQSTAGDTAPAQVLSPVAQVIRKKVAERLAQHAVLQAQQRLQQEQEHLATDDGAAPIADSMSQADGQNKQAQPQQTGSDSEQAAHEAATAQHVNAMSAGSTGSDGSSGGEATEAGRTSGDQLAGSHENEADSGTDSSPAGTQVSAAPPPQPPPQPALPPYVLPGNMTVEQVAGMLADVEAATWGNVSARDLQRGLAGLLQLAHILDDAVPVKDVVNLRQRVTGQHPLTSLPTTASGTAAAAAAPTASAKHLTLTQRIASYRNTGADIAARGAFALAALDAAGVLPASYQTTPGSALVRLHQAAQAGATEALLALADRFFQGRGVAQSCEAALPFAQHAAAAIIVEAEKEMRFNPPLAPLDLRERHMDARYVAAEHAENAPHILEMEDDMARRGNPEAQRRVAYRRLVGRGIEADPEGAFAGFQAAAAQGDAFAMFNMGYMHIRGLGPEKQANYTEARRLFEASADLGMAAGWNGLGVMHWNGQGGPQNLTAAREALLKAAAMNHTDSLFNLALMESNGIGVPRNETAGAEYYVLADLHGHWRAAANLAFIFEAGAGVHKDCARAEHYYRKFFRERASWPKGMTAAAAALEEGDEWGALLQYLLLAEQGDANAAVNAGWMLRHGLGYSGPRYLDMAMNLFEAAAAQNHTGGLVELGHMLMEASSLGVSRDPNITAAVSMWARAAEANHTEGLYLLGWAHQHGIGLPQPNHTRARALYQQAIKTAGTSYSRAMAPWAALLGMSLDHVLAPLFGPDATTRFAHWLRCLMPVEVVKHRGYMPMGNNSSEHEEPQHSELADQGTGVGRQGHEGEERLVGSRDGNGQGYSGTQDGRASWELALHQVQGIVRHAYYALGMDRVDSETLLMTALLGVLALVLWARQRQLAAPQHTALAGHEALEPHRAGQVQGQESS